MVKSDGSERKGWVMDIKRLKLLAEGIPAHIKRDGWTAGKTVFGESHIYAETPPGSGRQHIATVPAGAKYFGPLAEYIAAVSPDVILELIAQADSANQTAASTALLSDVAKLDTSQDCDPAHHDLVVRAMDWLNVSKPAQGVGMSKTNKDHGGLIALCPGCQRRWPRASQQAAVIAKYGTCCACRYRDNPPEGMTQEQCDGELTELFGGGPHFPNPHTHRTTPDKQTHKEGTE